MAITRYHPPFKPDTREHVEMEPYRNGEYVTYRDHISKTQWLKNRVKALEEQIESMKEDS